MFQSMELHYTYWKPDFAFKFGICALKRLSNLSETAHLNRFFHPITTAVVVLSVHFEKIAKYLSSGRCLSRTHTLSTTVWK